MKTLLSLHVLLFSLAIASMSAGSDTARAAEFTIDFSSMPDGTAVTAGNPYGGVVDLVGQGHLTYFFRDPMNAFGNGPTIDLWKNCGVVQNGALLMDCGFFQMGPSTPNAIATPETAQTLLTATFLQPVTILDFTTGLNPYGVVYDYEGVNQDGTPFSGQGHAYENFGTQFHTPTETVLDAPAGGHFTSLVLLEGDNSAPVHNDPSMAGPGITAFSVSSMTFSVPESGSSVVLLLLGAAACLGWRRCSRANAAIP